MIRQARDLPLDTEHLREALADARAESARLAAELARVREAREGAAGGDLLRICVAALHLHGSLEPARVLAAVREIAVAMLQATGHALVEPGPGGTARVTDAAGVPADALPHLAVHPAVRAATQGRWLLPDGGERGGDAAEPCACVPLLREGQPAGALALFGLPAAPTGAGDRRLLEMLSTTLPLALRAARLHAADVAPSPSGPWGR